MCELLVRLVDKPKTGDVTIDCHRTQRGDVIVAMPDGHDWTPTERTATHWIIIKVPDMSIAEGKALTSAEPRNQKKHFYKRLFHIDPSVIPDHNQSITLSISTIRGAKRQKPPIVRPDVIGLDKRSDIIG